LHYIKKPESEKNYLGVYIAICNKKRILLKDLPLNFTENKLRLCAYLKMNLATKDIAKIMNINLNYCSLKVLK